MLLSLCVCVCVATRLGHRGSRRAAGRPQVWLRSPAAAADRSRVPPPGRHCRLEVCPGAAAYCPPCQPSLTSCWPEEEQQGGGKKNLRPQLV